MFLLKHHMDHSIGVYVIDRFTYHTLEFLETVNQNSRKTIYDLVSYFRNISVNLISEFFFFIF